MAKKEGMYSPLIGKKCYYGLAGASGKPQFLGCNRKNAIKDAVTLANKKRTGVLILKEDAVIRFVHGKEELEEIEKILRKKFR